MSFVKRQMVRAVLGLAMVIAFALPAAAQDMKIGVVSLPALIERAPQTKIAMDALQEEFAPRQNSLQRRRKILPLWVKPNDVMRKKISATCSVR